MTSYSYDLHIHSCLSPCADDDMTPGNIAGMGSLNGLGIMALTDHNTCGNCPSFFKACRTYGIVPVPGMELTTSEDVHIICLFPELENAMAFDAEIAPRIMPIKNRPEIFGNQLYIDGEDEVCGTQERLLISATDLDIAAAVKKAGEYGGVCYPAHIDRPSNGIIAMLGDIPPEYGFRCVEFNDGANETEYREKYAVVKNTRALVSSDAHRLWQISDGTNRLDIDDEPYSSSLVRRRLLELISK
ncbi:MAG: PHP domain-containing protein [Clostridia bacterium]|nr:PHP domain-containing protein [Clostridia bacterium]